MNILLILLNSAFITLQHKKEGADQPKDFRPISLVHSFAKLITKLLANRLVGVGTRNSAYAGNCSG